MITNKKGIKEATGSVKKEMRQHLNHNNGSRKVYLKENGLTAAVSIAEISQNEYHVFFNFVNSDSKIGDKSYYDNGCVSSGIQSEIIYIQEL